jgi:hypothetical protein
MSWHFPFHDIDVFSAAFRPSVSRILSGVFYRLDVLSSVRLPYLQFSAGQACGFLGRRSSKNSVTGVLGMVGHGAGRGKA